jgi:hypothetical protein
MPNFTDALGRTWPLSVSYATCKRIQSQCDINLLDVAQIDQTIGRMRLDNLLVGDIVLCLCSAECTVRGISLDSFQDALDGEALDSASSALLEGLAHFFRRGQKGRLLTEMISKLKQMELTATNQALADIERETNGKSGDLATVLQESST